MRDDLEGVSAVRTHGSSPDELVATGVKILAELLREVSQDGGCPHCVAEYLGRLALRP